MKVGFLSILRYHLNIKILNGKHYNEIFQLMACNEYFINSKEPMNNQESCFIYFIKLTTCRPMTLGFVKLVFYFQILEIGLLPYLMC
jgi:hypothetical protein